MAAATYPVAPRPFEHVITGRHHGRRAPDCTPARSRTVPVPRRVNRPASPTGNAKQHLEPSTGADRNSLASSSTSETVSRRAPLLCHPRSAYPPPTVAPAAATTGRRPPPHRSDRDADVRALRCRKGTWHQPTSGLPPLSSAEHRGHGEQPMRRSRGVPCFPRPVRTLDRRRRPSPRPRAARSACSSRASESAQSRHYVLAVTRRMRMATPRRIRRSVRRDRSSARRIACLRERGRTAWEDAVAVARSLGCGARSNGVVAHAVRGSSQPIVGRSTT